MAQLGADEEKRRQIVVDMHRAFTDIDADYLTGLFTDDAVVHMVMLDPIVGRDDLHAMFVRWRDDYPNIDSELVNAVVDDRNGPDPLGGPLRLERQAIRHSDHGHRGLRWLADSQLATVLGSHHG